MKVNELVHLALPFGAGIGLGVFYFGGLWLTVRKLPETGRPLCVSLSSFFARLAVVLVSFYFVMSGRWERLLVCLLGFLGARFILVRLWGPDRRDRSLSARLGG